MNRPDPRKAGGTSTQSAASRQVDSVRNSDATRFMESSDTEAEEGPKVGFLT